MEILSNSGIPNHVKLSTLLGKKVFTDKGYCIGRVRDLAFTSTKVIGVYVRSGLKKMLIGSEYIESFEADSIILKVTPISLLKGKLVFDKDGRNLGKVVDISRQSSSNEFSDVLVKRNIFRKPVRISRQDMEVIDKNIILNKVI